MNIQPLNIGEKQDHPDKIAQTGNIAEEYKITAEEFNEVVSKTNEVVDVLNEMPEPEPAFAPGTGNQYLAGDKTWKAANKLKNVIPGAAYTLTAADFDKKLIFTSNAPVTVTIPANIVNDGVQTTLRQAGNGQITIVAGAGVVLTKSDFDTFKTAAKGSVVGVDCDTANSYHVYGQLELL